MHGSDRYYVSVALEAMEKAYGQSRDARVGAHISRAINALHVLTHLGTYSGNSGDRSETDPYEMDEFNSAV
ncbi:hypothetical protein [Geobacter argillaceus]|uniref:Uncharacterized protein n=1 Tax=Geobacter argillaceus TaxID=345631 RepID=A0A562VMJ2_9BACT|nr:hypothetical protein [Geobacter argillaceus]TWJ19203.1 hypothetical protein JN12_01893 [Geobacter argillaceus]